MLHKCWLTFHESDGQIRVEMLGPSNDFSELVDPNDGSVRHAEPFTMHGGDWRIESVEVTNDLIHIKCIATATLVQFTSPVSSSRSSIRR